MANREIKTKVAIDGEKEYKESLKNINSALGTLKSELKLVESQYAGQANSYAALSAKGDVLSRMYDQQKEKVKAAAEQLEKAKKAQSDYAEKVSSAQSEISRCEAALAALGDETGDTTEEQAKLTAELEKAKGELSAAEKGYESTTRSVNSYQTQVNNAETELNKLGSELDKNASYMDEAAKSSDGCAESIDEYGKEVKKAGEDSEEAGKKFDKVKTAATALGTAAAAATAAHSWNGSNPSAWRATTSSTTTATRRPDAGRTARRSSAGCSKPRISTSSVRRNPTSSRSRIWPPPFPDTPGSARA